MVTTVKGDTSRFIKRRKRAKLSDNLQKICAICGAAAKGLHFGAMACNSCKAFFRRNVQSENYKSFTCKEKKSCSVVKDNRKMCQYCRFQKGLSVGMEVKWVMTDDERLTMWKSKLTRSKQQDHEEDPVDTKSLSDSSNLSASTVTYTMAYSNSLEDLSQTVSLLPEDESAIDHLVVLQDLVFSSKPYSEKCYGDTPSAFLNLFCSICQKLDSFFLNLDDYHEIPKENQSMALKSGVSMSLYLHGAYNYDLEERSWPAPNIKKAFSGPNISHKTVKALTKYPETYTTLMNFFDEYGKDFKDESVLALCCSICLFYDHVKSNLDAEKFVENEDNRFINLLRNYLQYKSGKEDGIKQLMRLMKGLFFVKKITVYHKINVKDFFNENKSVKKMSLRHQIENLSNSLNKSLIFGIPEFSSVLTPEEKTHSQLIGTNERLTLSHPQILPEHKNKFQFHHPLVNSLLGSDIRTNTFLSFKYKNILQLKLNNRRMKLRKKRSNCCSLSEEEEEEEEMSTNDTVQLRSKSKETDTIKCVNSDVTLFESDPIQFSHNLTNCVPFALSDKTSPFNSLL